MLFAAGLGTRLKPLTDNIPKALVGFNGQTLLEWNIKRLLKAGFEHIVVNVHHFAPLVIQYLEDNKGFGANIVISDESSELLDTGGGLKKASSCFQKDQPILIHNVDIISDIDLKGFYDYHCAQNVLATLAVRNRKSSRVLLFDEEDLLRGWRNNATGELKIPTSGNNELAINNNLKSEIIDPTNLTPFAFSGIQVINYKLLSLITESDKFSMIDVYLRLSANHSIKAFRHDSDYWTDVGKIEELMKAENEIMKRIK